MAHRVRGEKTKSFFSSSINRKKDQKRRNEKINNTEPNYFDFIIQHRCLLKLSSYCKLIGRFTVRGKVRSDLVCGWEFLKFDKCAKEATVCCNYSSSFSFLIISPPLQLSFQQQVVLRMQTTAGWAA